MAVKRLKSTSSNTRKVSKTKKSNKSIPVKSKVVISTITTKKRTNKKKVLKRVGSHPKGKVPESLKGKGFQKGVSGNPGGRPKGSRTSIRVLLERIGDELLHEQVNLTPNLKKNFIDKPEITMKEALFRVIYRLGLLGQQWAAHYIADYTEGKPKEHIVVEEKKLRIRLNSNKQLVTEPPEGEEYGDDDETEESSSDTDS